MKLASEKSDGTNQPSITARNGRGFKERDPDGSDGRQHRDDLVYVLHLGNTAFFCHRKTVNEK
jgi:hypothetical protein